MRSAVSIAILAALLLTTPGAAQQTELDGSIWTRFETRDITSGAATAFTWMQSRLGAAMTFSPLVRAYVRVQDSRRLGEEIGLGDTSADRLDLQQGYVELGTPGESPVWLRLGRQEYEVAFGRLIGIPIWSPVSRAYDGLVAAMSVGTGSRLDLFGFQITESTQTTNADDSYLFGAWGQVPLSDAQTLHLIGVHDRDNAVSQTARTTLFSQLDGRGGGVRYRAEGGIQVGTVEGQDIVSGSLLAIYAAVPWGEDNRGTLGLGVDRYGGNANPGAGESAGFSDLFGRNHRFLGFADLFTDPRANLDGRGLLDVDVRVTWQLRPDLQLRGDYHHFRLNDAQGYAGAKLADEIDLQLWGQVLEGLDIRAGASWVGAEDPLVDLGRTAGDQLFGYLQLSAGFWGGAPGGRPR